MPEKTMIERSPVRVFDRAIGGGLGAGNIGVVLSRNGGGKTGFLIGLAIDKLLQGKRVLYISTKESVEHVNDFFDQIFHAMAESLAMDEVEQFARRLKDWAREGQWPALRRYAEELEEQVQQFDLARLPKTLERFPEIRERLTTR